MRYVVKDIDTGHYLCGVNAWRRDRDADINQARVFHSKAAAQAVANQHTTRAYRYAAVPVKLTEETN